MIFRSASSANARWRRYAVLALGLAAFHTFIFASVWATLMARGDYIGPGAPLPRIPWLERLLAVLATPLFYLMPEQWEMALPGNDTLYLLFEAALNAGLWGVAIAALVYRLRSKG